LIAVVKQNEQWWISKNPRLTHGRTVAVGFWSRDDQCWRGRGSDFGSQERANAFLAVADGIGRNVRTVVRAHDKNDENAKENAIASLANKIGEELARHGYSQEQSLESTVSPWFKDDKFLERLDHGVWEAGAVVLGRALQILNEPTLC
jgi:hypothetical protein